MKIATLILAAGQSSRMGQPKQLLKVGNKTLLQQSIETALASSCHAVCCVVGANAVAILPHIAKYQIQIVENPYYQEGLSTSIVAGIQALEKDQVDAVLISLADQPKITSTHLDDLINLWREKPQQAVATAYENSLGVPALFPRQHFEDLKALTGDKGAKALLKQLNNTINSVPFSILTDIDTPEDYRDLLDGH